MFASQRPEGTDETDIMRPPIVQPWTKSPTLALLQDSHLDAKNLPTQRRMMGEP